LEFANAGGSILLVLTDLDVLLPSIGLLVVGALQGLAVIVVLFGQVKK